VSRGGLEFGAGWGVDRKHVLGGIPEMTLTVYRVPEEYVGFG